MPLDRRAQRRASGFGQLFRLQIREVYEIAHDKSSFVLAFAQQVHPIKRQKKSEGIPILGAAGIMFQGRFHERPRLPLDFRSCSAANPPQAAIIRAGTAPREPNPYFTSLAGLGTRATVRVARVHLTSYPG